MAKSNDTAQITRLKLYYENPLEIMDNQIETPVFYQRYLDMVLLIYSEYLRGGRGIFMIKNPI